MSKSGVIWLPIWDNNVNRWGLFGVDACDPVFRIICARMFEKGACLIGADSELRMREYIY